MSKQKFRHELHSTRFQQRKLIARRIGDELLLFDEQTSTAHCLNGIAGEMWMTCERESSAIEVIEVLRPNWPDIEEEVVWASLSKLAAEGLLETTVQENISTGRRELIRKLGFTAAVVLPIVMTSVLIPPAAAAASPCGMTGSLCGAGHPPCCAGFHCVITVCAPNG